MADTIKVRQMPQLAGARGPIEQRSAARSRSYDIVQPLGGTSESILRGLAALNPRLEQLGQQRMQQEADNAALAGQVAGQRMEIAGVPAEALAPKIKEATPPSAFGDAFAHGMTVAVAERYAIQAKQDMVQAYNDQRMVEGFDAETFVKGWTDEQFKGVSDPSVLAALGRMQTEALAEFRADQEKVRQERLKQLADTSVSAFTADRLSGPISAEEAHSRYHNEIVPFALATGRYTRKEIAQFGINQIAALSTELGGQPELFDAIDQIKDADGFTLADRNPELRAGIAKAREDAIRLREDRLQKSTEEERFRNLRKYDAALLTNPASITDDEVWNDDTSFRTTDEKLAFLRRRDAALVSAAKNALPFEAARNGTLGLGYSKEDQGKVMDYITADQVGALRSVIAAANADPTQTQKAAEVAATLGEFLVRQHRTAGSQVPAPAVLGLLNMAAQPPADPKAPLSPALVAAVEVYRTLSPEMRKVYAPDEDTERVLETFLEARKGAVDDTAAAHVAYRSVSPERKREIAEFLKSDAFKGKLDEAFAGIGGDRTVWWLPRFAEKWLGRIPNNAETINSWARQEAERLLKRNPMMSGEQAIDAALEATNSRWIMDAQSGYAYPAPPGVDTAQFSKTVAFYLEPIAQRERIGKLTGDNALVLQASNVEKGTYQIWHTKNGKMMRPLGEVSATQIMQHYNATTKLTDEDKALLAKLQTATTLSPEEFRAAAPVLAKGEQYGELSPATTARIREKAGYAANDRAALIPQVSFGKPDPANIVDQRPTIKTPQAETARAAKEWVLRSGTTGHVGLAAALVTVGESLELTAYDDPARGAGKNISTGYNLNANKEFVEKDLKRAGVPPERIADVIAGRASLTREQAMRLTGVALERYEQKAQAAVEKIAPDLWGRLTANQKAVVIDMAWQLGQSGLEKFKNAIGALEKGDIAAFAEHSKVKYTRKDGTVVEDTRRNNLRAFMLAGQFKAVLDNNLRIPATKLALN